jgi:membrane protease YdiL (CAAX protease family)
MALLSRNKLLAGYLVLGVLAAGLVSFPDAVSAIVNDMLLGVYALVIWGVTRGEPTLASPDEERPRRPRRDLVAVAAVYLLDVAFTVWFWFGGGIVMDMRIAVALNAAGLDAALAGRIGNAAPTSILLVLLLVLTLGVLRLRPAEICLRPRHLLLGVGLAAFTLGLGVLSLVAGHTGQLLGVSLPVLPGVFLVQALVNAIPEEIAFRGVILSRLVRLLRNPQHAILLSSILFVSSHAASWVAQRPLAPWWMLALLLVTAQPTGIAWGYLCHRTRSVWPGAIWHTSATVLGPIFF